MGKHVKKKNESPRFSRRREEAEESFAPDTWLDAAERSDELDDPNLDDALLFDDDLSPDSREPLSDDRVEQTLVEPEEEITPEPAAEPLSVPEEEPRAEAAPEAPGEDLFPAESVTGDFFSGEEEESAPVITESFASEKKAPAPAQPPRRKKPRPSPAALAKKKRQRRAKKFKKGLKTYAIIMLVLIVGICAALWVLLARYQRGVDERSEAERLAAAQTAAEKAEAEAVRRAPQQCFEAWEAGADSNYWTDLWFATHPMELESREMVQSFMEQRFASAVPYRAAEYTSESPVYVLRSGDDTLARIYLSGGGKDWTVSTVDLLVKGDKSASVSAITGSKIFCNGIELGEEYVTDSAVSFSYGPLSDRLVNPVSMLTYSVDGLLSEPVMTAEPPEGCNLVQTEDGGFVLCMSQAEGQPLQEKAVNFVRAYLYYFMSGLSNTNGNLWYALSFLTPGTQAYTDLQDTLNGVIWNTAYANINTDDTVASDVVIWADNCRSVDVRYSAKCTLYNEPIDYADATMRLYFMQADNGTFYISNYETL